MSIIQSNELQKMTGGDADLVADLAIMFVRQWPGLQSQMHFAIQSGDVQTVESCAHQLKSRVSYFGAASLRQRVEDMESQARECGTDELTKLESQLIDDIQTLIGELRQLTNLELAIED